MNLRICQLAAASRLCAMTLSAQAQTPTIYGLIDASVGRVQAPGGKASTTLDSGRMTTSFWGIKGGEDLGGGLSATYALESFMRADTGSAGRFNADTLWARNAYVGLASNSLGSVQLGRNTTSLFVHTLLFNAFGDSFGFSPAIRQYFTSGTTTGDTGWSDSVRYASPKLAGGLSFTAHGAMSESNGGTNLGASALYFAGPIGAGLAWQNVKKGLTVDNTTTWQLSGSFNLPQAKLFAQYGQVDNDSTNKSYSITGVGAAVPLTGEGKVLVQFGRLDPKVGATRNTWSLGYDHFLSKRTDLYTSYMNDKVSGLAAGNNYAVGVRHRF